jgi:hypothetical protein
MSNDATVAEAVSTLCHKRILEPFQANWACEVYFGQQEIVHVGDSQILSPETIQRVPDSDGSLILIEALALEYMATFVPYGRTTVAQRLCRLFLPLPHRPDDLLDAVTLKTCSIHRISRLLVSGKDLTLCGVRQSGKLNLGILNMCSNIIIFVVLLLIAGRGGQ